MIIQTLIFLGAMAHVQGAFVDPGVVFETWRGWGTSLAWFGDVLGGFDQGVQDEIINALFSPAQLNLNILRYTIGGTTPGELVCGEFRPGGGTESFKDGPDLPFNWNRDPRARKVLQAAKAMGVDTFEAFSNSPPQWMTISGCSKGNSAGGSLHANFDPVNASQFSDYLTEIVNHFHTEWNLTFTSLAPFNEPSSGYWNGASSAQEGCCMERSTMMAVIQALHSSIGEKGMNYVSISVGDETEINQELLTQETFTESGIANLYTKVNTHGYSDNGRENRAPLYTLSKKNGHALWMDEVGWQASPQGDMTQGIALAERVVYDIRNMNPEAWVYWQVMEDQQPWAWGLLDIPYTDPSIDAIRYNSGYHSFKQFTKYIKKGYKIVHVSDSNSIAAYDESSNILVIVTVNIQGIVRAVNYDLRLVASSSTPTVTATRTSATEENADLGEVPLNGEFEVIYNAPPTSITTFLVMNAVLSDTLENLLVNGDFESVGREGWSLLYGDRDDGAINGNYVYTGSLSGYLDFAPSELSLIQNVTVPESRTYYLSARVATSSLRAVFGILINGEQGRELGVGVSRGYEPYGISFYAAAQDVISVYVYGPRGASNAQIDNVVLH
ncbi:endo-beta-1,6-galactanase isoform X1 [Folsomia candida]|nr:endo-beta-1,6-galactanase isoform X1 [Folsomia candida]